MAGKITFEVTKGSLAGKTFDYDEKTRIFIGRQEDCGIVVPENTISRYHCVLEITPPEVKLQDFGSLNGTFLNGEKIGQRDRDKSFEDVRGEVREEYTLANGDVLGLGSKCELKLSIESAETCGACGAELSKGYSGNETVSEDAPPMRLSKRGERICEDCYIKEKQVRLEADLAEKKAKEEAELKKAEQARIAAEQAEKERKEAERQQKERERQEHNRIKREEDEAQKKKEIEDRKRREAEQRRIEEEKLKEAERQRIAAEKAADERKEAERLAREVAQQLAQQNKQKTCAGCGKKFTPTAADNNLCSDCLADRAKMIDAVLKDMLGAVFAEKPQERAVGPSPVKGYEKIKLLGKGGMGEVWKVRDTSTGKFYALKTMLPQVKTDDTAKKLFLREAQVSRFLKHKNVVGTYQTGSANGIFYIIMDLCEGGSVDSLMERNGGKLSLVQATYIILQVLSGLEYVHNVDVEVEIKKGLFKGTKDAQGVVHRDFKPGNIFLSDTSLKPTALVADFGMAKAFDTAGLSKITKTGAIMGTPVFMPRQQAITFKYAKPEVDVWAAAASYYNMLTGAFPKNFRPGKNVWQIIVTETAVPIRNRDSSIPAKLAAVIDRALVEMPNIGYNSAATLRRDIVSALPDNIRSEVKEVLK